MNVTPRSDTSMLVNRQPYRSSYSSQIITIALGIITLISGIYLIFFRDRAALNIIGYCITPLAAFVVIIGTIKCYFNKILNVRQKKPECVVNHWLYRVVPRNWESITCYKPWEYATWTLVGNDDDGIFGEEPSSGRRWLIKWAGGKETKNPGEISFKRFLCWNLRNPLHNFTFYVIGFAAWENIPLYRVALITSNTFSFFKKQELREIFPMGSHSGIYVGLHPLPGLSWRFNIPRNGRIEGYLGYRTRGNFGLSLRFKHSLA